MRALDRKLLRDLWTLRGQAVAISLVLACGVGTFVASLSVLGSLQLTQATYYERHRFADVFARLKRAPESLAERVAEIPGVAKVQTRVVVDVTLDVAGMTEPAVGRLVSVSERREPGLNEVYLRQGRWIEPGGVPAQRVAGEVLIGDAFAEAHNFKPGDSFSAVINGRKQRLTVVGIALSPEYIFPIREGEMIPDYRRYGILWMGRQELAAAYDMQGAFNDLALTLTPGASADEVIRQVDRLIEHYGGLGAFGRADQVSNKFISNEIMGLRAQAVVSPSIFLSVAAFLLNIAVSRLVGAQREQIAALKAFGYGGREIAGHYLKLVLVLVLAGLVLGTALGAWLGHAMTGMYAEFYRFPEFSYHLDADIVLWALVISGGAALAGTLGSIRRAARLPPAEAMRPEPPARYRPTFVEHVLPQRWLSPAARMVLRNLARRPVRTFLSALGIALATSVVILGNFVEDAVDVLIDFQFFASQRQDVTVTFVEPAPARVLSALRHLPGVREVEPFRAVAVRVRHGHRERRLGVQGLPADPRLHRTLDAHTGEALVLPPEGLVVSAKLAEVLGIPLGEVVTVEVLEGKRPVRAVPVVGLLHDYSEPAAFMRREALNRLMHEGDAYSGAHLAVDRDKLDDLYTTLKQAPKVAGVTIKEAALRSFEKTLAENLLMIKAINVAFACVIACGVVYNNARIALAERSRDLASLRVLGFTRGEVSAILLGELGVLTAAGIPAGLAIGYGMVQGAVVAMDTELQRIPGVVGPATYALAVVVVVLAALASGLWVRRGLDKLDLVAVLKARE
jgi:putative ABC transport system permease protein